MPNFSELFAYSAGALVPNAGWTQFVTNNPVVASAGTVVGVASAVARAYNNALTPGIDWTQPWSIVMSYEENNPPVSQKLLLLGGAVETAGATWSAKFDIAGATVTWTGPDGTTASHSAAGINIGVQSWSVSYDGVSTVTITAGSTVFTTPSGSMAGSTVAVVGFEIDSNSAASFPKVHGLSGTYNPLVAGVLGLVSRSSSTVVLATTASSGGSGTRLYQLQRAPDNGGTAGNYANVGAQQSGLTFSDSGRLPATPYWYRVAYADSTGDSVNGLGIMVTTLAVAGVLASALSPFELLMIGSALDKLYGQFGVAGVYSAADGTSNVNCTLRIHRAPVREVERPARSSGELQTAEIMVRLSELAVIEKGGRFVVGGGTEVWTVANRPLIKNGEQICDCVRTGADRLMPRRVKE